MAAYILVQVEVTDNACFAQYRTLAEKTVVEFGGRYVVRGGETTVLEGSWQPGRVVVLEFPDAERAKAFYASPSYTKVREVRKGAAKMDMLLVEGLRVEGL